MRRFNLAFWAGVACFLSLPSIWGCGRSGDVISSNPANELKAGAGTTSDTLEPIDGPILFGIGWLEWRDDSTLTPVLGLRTEEEYGCGNMQIAVETHGQGRAIIVRILGLRPPTVCIATFGPATATIPLDLPSGRTPLHIEYNGRKDIYQLIVSDHTVEIRDVRTSYTFHR